MTDTMLERMARAIDPEAFESTADEPRIVQVRAGTRQREAVAKARAALEAIREPDEKGIRAAANGFLNDCPDGLSMSGALRAYIDAILSEGQPNG